MMTLLILWMAGANTLTAAACVAIAMHQRRSGLLVNPKYYPAEVPDDFLDQTKPAPKTIEVDEFLKNGEPMNPPEFVPDTMHPTLAARQRTRIEGVRYTTRRVIKEVQ